MLNFKFIPSVFISLILLSVSVMGQSLPGRLSLTGKVTDQKALPVALATIKLQNAKDSSTIKGAVTNENGQYSFNHLAAGNFIVSVSFVGYIPARSAIIHLTDSASHTTISPIIIQQGAGALAGVTITASRPLIEHQPGKTIVHVGNSILAVGNNALEILDRAPGISIDEYNNVSLRGKRNVVILINGKQTYLSGDQLASLLSATDGGQIEAIEILTTPPANYSASGSAGLINIKLKKSKDQGVNGNLTLGAGYVRSVRDNTSLNLNYRDGKFGVFGSFSRSDKMGFQDFTINRLIHHVSGVTAFNQLTNTQNSGHNNNLGLGADYDLSSKQTISIGFSGYLNNSIDNLSDITTIGKVASPMDSLLRTRSISANTFRNYAFNINDCFQFSKPGHKLNADFDYSRVKNNSDYRDTNRFYRPDQSLLHEPQVLTNQTPSEIHIYAVKADYANPFSKNVEFNAGAKFSKVSSDNNLNAQVLKDQLYINDTTRTNHFLYREQILAGYINFKGRLNAFEWQLGVRSEYTRSDGELVGSISTRRNYIDFFPSFSLSRPLGNKNNLSFSYSRRIDRPAYDELNPFVNVLDPFSKFVGNAFLNPQYADAIELGYLYNQFISVTLGYSHTAHAIVPVVITQGQISFQTSRNIDQLNSWNINVNIPYKLTKWWSGNLDLNGYDNRYRSDSLAGSSIRTGKPSFSAKNMETFQFGSFKTEVQVNYRSSHAFSVFNIKPRFSTDLAISKTLLDNRASIIFAISDVLKTSSVRTESHLLNNDFTYKYLYDTRIFRLNFNYKFGNNKLKKHQQRSGAEDESGRVKQSS
jgi:hypothetical protein